MRWGIDYNLSLLTFWGNRDEIQIFESKIFLRKYIYLKGRKGNSEVQCISYWKRAAKCFVERWKDESIQYCSGARCTLTWQSKHLQWSLILQVMPHCFATALYNSLLDLWRILGAFVLLSSPDASFPGLFPPSYLCTSAACSNRV